jgi:hypothetical protein
MSRLSFIKMKTFIFSVLALGFIWQAGAITITAYSDGPSMTPGSGCQTALPAGLVATAEFTNPFTCPLNACCFFKNFTMSGQPTISYYFKATACTEGNTPPAIGSYTYNSFYNEANCTTGGSSQTGTTGSCMTNFGPQWTGIAALKVTCTPPASPSPKATSLGALAFVPSVALLVAALAVCL